MVFSKRSEMQFRYWDERRRGVSQSEISRKYDVTRQNISKAIKVQEREVMIRLLDIAQVSSIFPEWYSVEKGILIGTIPLLNNSKCLLLIDGTNNAHLFYDPNLFGDLKKKKQSLLKLLIMVKETVGLNKKFEGFHMILEAIIQGG